MRQTLRVGRVVDLTRALSADLPMWPGQPGPVYETVLKLEDDGVYLQKVEMWEHTGTHLDAPSHFFANAMTVDEIPLKSLVCPVSLIDISKHCVNDSDYALSLDDVEEFEKNNGPIPAGSAVLVRTGWDEFLDDQRRYLGREDDLHFPGVGEAAARLLVEERRIVGIGTDTMGVDPGCAHDFPVHSKVTLPNGVWNLEELVRLEQVPPTGALLVVGVLPLCRGSGAPARVFVLVSGA